MPKLHHFTLCPFSRRARLALSEYGEDAELNLVRPWEADDALLTLNPAGDLPVLAEDDGSVVAGIASIGEYLDETRGLDQGRSLIGNNALMRAETRRLVAWFDDKFNAEVTLKIVNEKVHRRFGGGARGRSAPNMAELRIGLQNIRCHLEYIGWLAERRKWLAGDELTIADLAAAAHISCIDYLGDVPWSASDGAKAWYQRIKSRPAFRPLLADSISGITPPRHYADLDF